MTDAERASEIASYCTCDACERNRQVIIAAVRAEEREACARIAEATDASVDGVRTFGQYRDTLCDKIAAAIRGRQP